MINILPGFRHVNDNSLFDEFDKNSKLHQIDKIILGTVTSAESEVYVSRDAIRKWNKMAVAYSDDSKIWSHLIIKSNTRKPEVIERLIIINGKWT